MTGKDNPRCLAKNADGEAVYWDDKMGWVKVNSPQAIDVRLCQIIDLLEELVQQLKRKEA